MSCATWSDLPCTDGGAPTQDGGPAGHDAGEGANPGGGCTLAAAARPASPVALALLLFTLGLPRRRR